MKVNDNAFFPALNFTLKYVRRKPRRSSLLSISPRLCALPPPSSRVTRMSPVSDLICWINIWIWDRSQRLSYCEPRTVGSTSLEIIYQLPYCVGNWNHTWIRSFVYIVKRDIFTCTHLRWSLMPMSFSLFLRHMEHSNSHIHEIGFE